MVKDEEKERLRKLDERIAARALEKGISELEALKEILREDLLRAAGN